MTIFVQRGVILARPKMNPVRAELNPRNPKQGVNTLGLSSSFRVDGPNHTNSLRYRKGKMQLPRVELADILN